MENNLVDCCIIGGSAAGLSAALILGRCNRKVLVFDDGSYRNYAVDKMNGYLGYDGVDPKEFRTKARKDLEKYDVKIINSAEGCKAAISCSSYIRKVWGK